jgi:hypothetical protein
MKKTLTRRGFVGALGAGLAPGVFRPRPERAGPPAPRPAPAPSAEGGALEEYSVGMGQILVEGAAVEANLERAAATTIVIRPWCKSATAGSR